MVYVIIAVIVLLFIIYVIVESSGFRCVYYNLQTDRINRESLKIVMLSDLHNKDYGDENEPLVQAIDSFSPDLVCMSGDMITSGYDFHMDYGKTLRFIEKLAKKYPVFYGFGNHERYYRDHEENYARSFGELQSALNAMGVKLLDNAHTVMDDLGITVYGLNLEMPYYRRFKLRPMAEGQMEEDLGAVDKEHYSILLAHNPEYFPEYAVWGADLVLAGHHHGGIVNLPLIGGVISPGFKLFPKYDAGLFHEGSSTMLLSRGIGSHTIPIRINNKAEIVCITIDKKG
ncbi:MAG: metallophosphoesterase [Lachnospiraceae bacterium]|nr:metallophosphoesterase [Lachnospiraceae bacterium]